jgi:transposase
MRQTHRAGDKAFVDYSGDGVGVIDGGTGEIRRAEIFVGVLGASSYTYAEATWTQELPDWIGSHVRMLNYFHGSPCAIVPDYVSGHIIRVMWPTALCGFLVRKQRFLLERVFGSMGVGT